MTPNPTPSGSARSADVINDDIRALWARARGSLTPEERAEYERLLAEWADAIVAAAWPNRPPQCRPDSALGVLERRSRRRLRSWSTFRAADERGRAPGLADVRSCTVRDAAFG
ncbi:hypothetical protein [Streptomyces sp. NPDC005244]|uniref:hypothetical protein n=1 Tax=Streptomyces sp. NPDC005244 TaxID=3364708 RepID=UPI0036B342EE